MWRKGLGRSSEILNRPGRDGLIEKTTSKKSRGGEGKSCADMGVENVLECSRKKEQKMHGPNTGAHSRNSKKVAVAEVEWTGEKEVGKLRQDLTDHSKNLEVQSMEGEAHRGFGQKSNMIRLRFSKNHSGCSVSGRCKGTGQKGEIC